MGITAQDSVHTRVNQNDIQMTICLERREYSLKEMIQTISFVII